MADAAPGQDRPDRVVVERFRHEVGHGHGQHPQDRPTVVPAETLERPSQAQPGQRVAEPGRPDVGRRLVTKVGQELRQGSDAPVEVGIAVGIQRRDRAQRIERRLEVAPQREAPAVRLRREDPDRRRDELEAMLAQAELANHGRPQSTDRLGDRRHSHAGHQLERVRRPTEPLARLHDQHRSSGAGEVRRRGQAVVTATDDDRVVSGFGHGQATRRSRDLSTSSAANRPLAPIRPPPGWVDDPLSHSPSIGVRNRA